ncbi:MAG TPA: COX15/CtaA family protein [Gaiellaceae bacterium]|nr:COX15/CtaA family protein [Gaiellaceae bacterium]
MNATTHGRALARERFALSADAFRRVALGVAAILVLIVATGATVRLTASGLGCRHWPGCQPGAVLPERGYHSYIEFSNRVVAAFTVLATLVLAVAALRTRALDRRAKALAWAVFAGTLAQAPLGAITVYFDLNPWLVLSHLLLSLVVLALGVLVWLEASRASRGAAPALPAAARAGGACLLASVSVLLVAGTIVTASGPHPGGQDVRRLTAFQPALEWHVRATAVFGIVFLGLALWGWANRDRFPWLPRAAGVLLVLLGVQMAIGEVQYRTRLPWWLVLIHVTMAACVFAWTVGLVARLWRPVAARRA